MDPKNLKEALDLFQKLVKGAGDAPTDAQVTEIAQAKSFVEKFKADEDAKRERVKSVKANQDFLRELQEATAGSVDSEKSGELTRKGEGYKSIGEFFAKRAGDQIKQQAGGAQLNYSVGEYVAPRVKAASDPASTATLTDEFQGGYGTTWNRNIIYRRREKLVVADLMDNLTMTNTTIKYLKEKANRVVEGGFKTVAEGGKKPYMRFADFDIVTESLSKIAGLTKITDEMIEDYDFLVSYINARLLEELAIEEERQLLLGDGTGNNLTGLLKRDGIQTLAVSNKDELADSIYKAMTNISLATPFQADALVINPLDYQDLRLAKDANGQYYGGGVFQGQYGSGGIMLDPAPWGLRTVQSQVVPVGKPVVGAFRSAASVLRKGGVRIDSTNTNVDDFENNLITVRAEERVGLMVTFPEAIVQLDVAEAVTP